MLGVTWCWLIMVGFLLGTRQTILETKDGGNTWAPRTIPSAEDEDFNYRFNSISFKGKEGWIVGKPAILLYTSDAGQSWERIPLSAQLPGDMVCLVWNSNEITFPSYNDHRQQQRENEGEKICFLFLKKINQKLKIIELLVKSFVVSMQINVWNV